MLPARLVASFPQPITPIFKKTGDGETPCSCNTWKLAGSGSRRRAGNYPSEKN